MSAATFRPSSAWRATSLALLAASLAMGLLAAPKLARNAAAQTPVRIKLEAESYIQPYDYGGEPVSRSVYDSTASGFGSVWGLDYPGDWIELDVYLPRAMWLQDSLRSAGDTGLRRKWVVMWELTPPWSPVIDTLATTPPGTGIT